MVHEQIEPIPPASANLSTTPEELFEYLLARVTGEVFERAINSEPMPLIKFDISRQSGELRDVRFLETEATGESEERLNKFFDQRYRVFNVVTTTKSVATGERSDETKWVRSQSPGEAEKRLWAGFDRARPEGVVRSFLHISDSPESFDAVLDVLCSDTFLAAVRKNRNQPAEGDGQPLKLDSSMGHPIANLILKYPGMIPHMQESLLRHMEASADTLDFSAAIHRLDVRLGGKLSEMLQEGTMSSGDPLLPQIADFLTPFESLDTLAVSGERGYSGTLGYVEVATIRPFSELLLRNLAKRPLPERQSMERRNTHFAKEYLAKTLERFAGDPERHAANIAKVRAAIFPDDLRPDSLSRYHLVKLSNRITMSDNAKLPPERRKPLIDITRPGGIKAALANVLSVTTANHASQSVAAQHVIENRMITDIVTMLMESNYVPEQRIEERNISAAGLAAYVGGRQQNT